METTVLRTGLTPERLEELSEQSRAAADDEQA